mmetsp:Transcript_2538/g.5707  ORF Transcript_2538/g.5707 Transcript_2538/m.5707 type:complete len:202 (-) Transcript_2538:593-1198(-)
MGFSGIMCIGNSTNTFSISGGPQFGSSRCCCKLPLISKQNVKISIIPFGWTCSPCPFQSRSNCISSLARSKLILPAETLVFQGSSLRLDADIRWIAGSVTLSECVATSDQSHGFFVIHRHATKGFTDISSCSNRITVSFRSFWVDINQTHLDGTQGIVQFSIPFVSFVGAQPFAFLAPVHIILGLPNILTTSCKTKRFESH